MKSFENKVRAHALKNAIAHDGKAQPGAVISAMFSEGLKKEDVKKYIKDISKVINEVNKLGLEQQEKEYLKLKDIISEREVREGLAELPNVKKTGVIMRFRPAPSGPIHIGNMIGAGLPTCLYVEKYGGKFYVIIDDTDPEKTLPESYKNAKRDCDWLFGNVTKYLASSDRMETYYNYAEKLMKKKAAYVCTCSANEFKKYVEQMKDCPCRNLSVDENMKRWKKMLEKSSKRGQFKEGESVVRFKSEHGMKDPNPAMRDFPLARINEHEHPKQGKKYRVWPLMNLVVPVDDMELKMTHIIRGKDHMDNAKRQKMIFDVFKKEFPWTFFIGRLNFKDLDLSKRKITAGIKSGEFSGEDDEKLATISSLRRRGYKPEAFKKFVEQRGLTEVDKVIDSKDFFKIIETFGRE